MSRAVPDRLLRFALETTDGIDAGKLFTRVELALGQIALEKLPTLLRVDHSFWDYHATAGRRLDRFGYEPGSSKRGKRPLVDEATLRRRKELVMSGKSPGIPIKLEPFIADTAKRTPKLARKLGRHQFYILTLPYYEGTFRRGECKGVGKLFEISYELRAKCKLASAVPDLPYPHYQTFSASFGLFRDCPDGTAGARWHLDNINFDSVPPGVNGTGIRIGHPDTGWTPHPQLNFTAVGSSSNYDLTADVNIRDPNSASAEEAVPATVGSLNPHHGTATGGLHISRADNQVNGLAPGATVISIRAIDSVVLIADIDVTNAVVAAVDAGAHVISLSLGGYPAPILEWAINWAVANNVIVVAAAGNQWPYVVYPAAYPACIAVGGSTIEDTVWEGSARDHYRQDLIDISAPAECVQVPIWNGSDPETGPGSGTSFAAAIVAGAAALWLQRFDRNALISGLAGRSTLQELFRTHLRHTARRPSGWDVWLDGPGILDLSGLVAPGALPDPAVFPFPPIVAGIGNLLGVNVAGTPGNRFTPPGWLEALFGSSAEAIVDQFGEEIVTMVMTDPVLASLTYAMGRQAELLERAVEDAQNAVGAAAVAAQDFVEGVKDELEKQVEEFVDTASGMASDTMAAVAGWIGL
jgi:hypothetical protein